MKSFDVENEVTEPQVPTFDRVLDLAINPVPVADDPEYEGKTVLIIPVDDPVRTVNATEAVHAIFTVAAAVYIAKLGPILEEVYRGCREYIYPGGRWQLQQSYDARLHQRQRAEEGNMVGVVRGKNQTHRRKD